MLSKSITGNKFYYHGKEITADEYDHILNIIRNKPTAPDGYGYRLTDGIEWELYVLPVETDEEVSDGEVMM